MVNTALNTITGLTKSLMLVEDPVREARLACCHACEHYRASDDRCLVCGCLMCVKAAVKFTDCPRGLWAAAGKEKQ